MLFKKSLFSKKEQSDVNNRKSDFLIKPVFFDGKKIQHVKRRAIVTFSTCIMIIGVVALLYQSSGYTVFYDGEAIGFVDKPEMVIDNIDEINKIISYQKDKEATVYNDKFSFEKGIRLFHYKEDINEIATVANEKCQIDVNAYNIYIDDVCVAQDSSIDNFQNTIGDIETDYKNTYTDDQFDTIGFAQKVEVRISKAKETDSMSIAQMKEVLASSLDVKTTSHVKEQTTVPYEVVYEPTDVKNTGEAEVKNMGVEGLIETTRLVEKRNGVEVASTDIKSEVLVEKVDQVVLIGTNGLPLNESGMLSPTRGCLTSRMGPRWGRMHKGIDIGGSMDEPVLAVLPGTVLVAEYNENGYGNMVKIDHGNGLETLYGHLNQINVNVGDEIRLGEVIGLMGNTGRSTGTHLHFEVILDGENVDPLEYVNY